jgi:hypothetical protein
VNINVHKAKQPIQKGAQRTADNSPGLMKKAPVKEGMKIRFQGATIT